MASQQIHPTLSPADISTMSPDELAFFTDAPVAQVCAFYDFRRQWLIDERNKRTIESFTSLRLVS